ncbi:hypothetical protein MANES_14G011400v8 [Manihot esculenta]|uniref:Uncharacterized protein n=1 Tax=Manihot esculenta TaxID=3983 RepID=A0A2C9UIS2_MANES|nr:hypothetical protein MANES_14G011400v8 [Manihot esculenta]
MYYLTLVAYYIYFNSLKVMYGVCVLVLGLFYMYILSLAIADTQKLHPSLFNHHHFITNFLFLQLQDTAPPLPPSSNHSYYSLSLLSASSG